MTGTRPIRPIRRPNMRRAVILFPSGLTLGNLFFGIFAIIAASRLEFTTAGVYVLLGGLCDALDGRVARATNAGTEFGEELDSLVDAITFGLAPGMIMYFAVLNRDGWDWIVVFLFAACAVMRLARFNIEQAGTAKEYFQGLPSPAAGITLASYYWFSQSPLYAYGAIGGLPWHVLLRILMAVLSFLMISNIPYPSLPRTGFRSLRSIGATLVLIGSAVLLATRRLEYFFPCALIYVLWGLVRWVFAGLFERRQPTVPYDLSEGEDDEDDEEFELTDSRVHARRQGYRNRPITAETPVVLPERPLRGEREERARRAEPARTPERAARSDRAASPEADRAARRDKKKKERPERTERTERPERPERPKRPERATPSAAASAVAAPVTPAPTPTATPVAPAPSSGVGAITIDTPPDDVTVGDGESPYLAEGDTGEMEATTAGESAPSRRRKRRRRRGGRDRGASDNAPADAAAPSDVAGPAESSADAPPPPPPLPSSPIGPIIIEPDE
jgi:CDP-diacylglycerol--serine O-phosphatidyltransferase